MAGITATISVESFRADWLDHAQIVHLCERYSITKDQVIRLRDVWALPLRHDRKLRAKPKRQSDPTPEQIEAACLRIQATWDERVRDLRTVTKSSAIEVRSIEMSSLPPLPAESDE